MIRAFSTFNPALERSVKTHLSLLQKRNPDIYAALIQKIDRPRQLAPGVKASITRCHGNVLNLKNREVIQIMQKILKNPQ